LRPVEVYVYPAAALVRKHLLYCLFYNCKTEVFVSSSMQYNAFVAIIDNVGLDSIYIDYLQINTA